MMNIYFVWGTDRRSAKTHVEVFQGYNLEDVRYRISPYKTLMYFLKGARRAAADQTGTQFREPRDQEHARGRRHAGTRAACRRGGTGRAAGAGEHAATAPGAAAGHRR